MDWEEEPSERNRLIVQRMRLSMLVVLFAGKIGHHKPQDRPKLFALDKLVNIAGER
jgi:hypothetical protein